MATLREQAKTSIPRVFRNTLTQGNNSLDSEREQFERDQLNAVIKALSITESPVKEKHVRTIIIGTFKQKTSQTFWSLVSSKAPLHGNPIVCWKFLHILHKMIREGHPRVVQEAARHKGLIEDLGKLWGHLKEGYGMLISLYCKLMVVKLDFHEKNPDFPGSLSVDKETLIKIGNNDAGNFYELCIEFLDFMDEILDFEKGVFNSLDMSKSNSMTSTGQCRLAPLIVCIQDSVHLYDYTVKLLFLLHQHLPPDTLSGHTTRFLNQFGRLKKFYFSSSNLQYFKHLVQVPSLPDLPPNFLVASELSSHVTPVAVVPDQVQEQDDMDDSQSEITQQPIVDERERYIDQLLAELELLQIRVTQLEEQKMQLEGRIGAGEEQLRAEQGGQERLRAEIGSNQAQIAALTAMVQEAQQIQAAAGQEQDKNKTLEEKFIKLKEVYQKLREEHINLLRLKADVDKKLASSDIGRKEAVKSREVMEKKVEEFLGQIAIMKETMASTEGEQSKQVHNLQATNVSLSTKLSEAENETRQKEESLTTLETSLLETQSELTELRIQNSDANQNKHNLEMELLDVSSCVKELELTTTGQEEIITELKQQVENKNELISAKNTALCEMAEAKESSTKSHIQAALSAIQGVRTLEDIESITASGYSLIDICQRMENHDLGHSSVFTGHFAALIWSLGKGVINTCPDVELGDKLSAGLERVMSLSTGNVQDGGGREELMMAVGEVRNLAEGVLKSLGKETDLADIIAQEIVAMDVAIEAAAQKIEELLAASRAKDTGAKLEVNEAVLDSCTGLVAAIRDLVNRAKQLQKEIVEEAGGGRDKEFYKKNSRWTEGLISAAKAVGLGAKLLVDAADRVVLGSGGFEEIMVASQEVAASTAQLVIASRVKAKDGSQRFHELRLASKVVTEATGAVVAVAKSSWVTAENVDLDFSRLSAHQSKTLEMETQVRLLKLEAEVEKERSKLSTIRRQNYRTGSDGAE